jgi:hypothetical protein
MNIEDIPTIRTVPLPDCQFSSCDFNLNNDPTHGGFDGHEFSVDPPVIPWASSLETPLAAWPRVFPGL